MALLKALRDQMVYDADGVKCKRVAAGDTFSIAAQWRASRLIDLGLAVAVEAEPKASHSPVPVEAVEAVATPQEPAPVKIDMRTKAGRALAGR